jgi:phosphohistidine phosphatase
MSAPFLRLVVMRHAKSDQHGGLADHARPLNDRGRIDAPRVAGRLDELGWVPDHVISSDAARTVETWACMEDRLRTGIDPVFSRRLYLAGWMSFCQQVAGATGETVLLLGHNPGWEEVVELLCGESIAMTTSNAVLLRRDVVPWNLALEPDGWALVDVVRPKEL